MLIRTEAFATDQHWHLSSEALEDRRSRLMGCHKRSALSSLAGDAATRRIPGSIRHLDINLVERFRAKPVVTARQHT